MREKREGGREGEKKRRGGRKKGDIPSQNSSKFNKNWKIRTEVRRGGRAIDALGECACTGPAGRQAAGPYVAYRLVHCLAIRSCSALLVMYCVAMLPTRGSAGLQSVRSEHMERRTLEMVRAGLQLSFRMSRQITPWLLILQ